MWAPERYEIVRFLGKGGLARVYLAHDRALGGRRVAIKRLSAESLERPEVHRRFRREAKILQGLGHPHLLEVYDYEADGPEPFLTMEVLEGGDLAEHLQARGALPLDEALRLGEQVASALDALHAAGVVHRDLKPQNIMLRGEGGDAVVMDLGLASARDTTVLTQTGQLLGTPRYFAPESLLEATWSPASDQYQLGAVLFEALTGRKLIEGRDIQAMLEVIREGPRPAWPPELSAVRVPAHTRDAIARAVERDPAARFSSCGAFLRAARDPDFVDEGGAASRPAPALRGPALDDQPTLEGVGAAGSNVGKRLSTTAAVAPSRRRGPPPALVVGLVGAGLAAGFLWGAPAPRDLGWTVVGDVVVARFRRDRADDLTLRVDGGAVQPETRREGEDWRLSWRGLDPGRSVEVTLAWPGGEAGFQARGQPPALRGPPRPGPEGWTIEALRAVDAWWVSDPGARRRVEAGVAALPPLRADQDFALAWEEEGQSFGQRWPRNEVLGAARQRLLARVRGIDLRPRLAAAIEDRVPIEEALPGYLRDWRAARPLVPALLTAAGPRAERLELWNRWQDARRVFHTLVAMGQAPPPPPLPPDQAGAVSQVPGTAGVGDGGWPEMPREAAPSQRIELRLVPDFWSPSRRDVGHIYLTSDPSSSAGLSLHSTYGKRVDLAWPAGLPRDGRPVQLYLRPRYQDSDCEFLLARQDEGEGFTLALVHPDPAPDGFDEDYGTWTRVIVPADLLPEAGTPMRIHLRPVSAPTIDKGILIDRMVLAW